jgi:hypothetical protein
LTPIVMETADPIGCVVPAAGLWLSTVPMLLQVLSTTVPTLPRVR